MENIQLKISPYGQIYRLTNKINGKMYHGQTVEENINNRWSKYRKLKCKDQPKLYNALKAYGPENFLFEVIDTTPQNQSQLDELEIFYIAKFDSMNNGYNCDPGGKGGHRSNETKQKISKAFRGRTLSEEHKRKIGQSRIGNKNPMFGRQPPNTGKHHSEEIREKISNSCKGRIISEETRNKIRESLRLTRELKKQQIIEQINMPDL